MQDEIKIIGIQNFPIIKQNDSLIDILIHKIHEESIKIDDGDVIVITQRICSISEGRIKNLNDFKPRKFAIDWATKYEKDPRLIEAILQESKSIIRSKNGLLITETKHGFICANSGIDNSNVEGIDNICLLPKDPDKTCLQIKTKIKRILNKNIAVIMTDTFGRPWRMGQTNIAIGVAGINPINSYVGQQDIFDRTLNFTEICIADEIAGAAELIMGKTKKIPVAILKGYKYKADSDSISNIIRDKNSDLFR